MNLSNRLSFQASTAFLVSLFFLLSVPVFADTVHTVAKGETLYSIARQFGISQDEILSANGIKDPSRIFAGQSLTIPVKTPAAVIQTMPVTRTSSPATAYKAQRGDSLYGIARKYGITVEELCKANNLPSDYMLKIGDSLKIPTIAEPAEKEAPSVTTPAAQVAVSVTPPVLPSKGLWPVTAQKVEYTRGKVLGVMLSTDRGEAVKSVSSGQVLSSGPYRGYGNVAVVETDGGYVYVYGNCSSLSVKPGDKVQTGTIIGTAQNSEEGGGEVFFSVYRNSKAIDPAKAPRV